MDYVKAFETIVKEQLERVERMKSSPQSTDYKSLDKVIVGIIDGDGIGPIITQACKKIMEQLMAEEIAAGKLELRDIEGLTIENRVEKMETVPAMCWQP